MRAKYSKENRWDYLLGYNPSGAVIGLEPHSARQDEVATVIKKRIAAMDQLSQHLKTNSRVAVWLWVASGEIGFTDTGKFKLRLSQHGITFVGKRVFCRHLTAF